MHGIFQCLECSATLTCFSRSCQDRCAGNATTACLQLLGVWSQVRTNVVELPKIRARHQRHYPWIAHHTPHNDIIETRTQTWAETSAILWDGEQEHITLICMAHDDDGYVIFQWYFWKEGFREVIWKDNYNCNTLLLSIYIMRHLLCNLSTNYYSLSDMLSILY